LLEKALVDLLRSYDASPNIALIRSDESYFAWMSYYSIHHNRIGGVIISMLASIAVYRGFEPRSGQTKDYEICICCFSAKQPALRRKSKDWSAQNQNIVSELGNMSIHRLLFQWSSTINIQLSVLILRT
jgi:hypothetical protein